VSYITADDWSSVLRTPISDMRSALAIVVDKLQKAIYFLFLQVNKYANFHYHCID